MKERFRALIALCSLLLLFSCASGTEAEKEDVLNAVKQYNNMLKRTYMEGNINLMAEVATENQINKLLPSLEVLRARNSTMISVQKTFNVTRVVVKGDNAFLSSEETWEYWWQEMRTGKITKPQETETYKIRYNLVKKNDIWKVDKIEDAD